MVKEDRGLDIVLREIDECQEVGQKNTDTQMYIKQKDKMTERKGKDKSFELQVKVFQLRLQRG